MGERGFGCARGFFRCWWRWDELISLYSIALENFENARVQRGEEGFFDWIRDMRNMDKGFLGIAPLRVCWAWGDAWMFELCFGI